MGLNYNLANQVVSDTSGNSYGYDGQGRRVREQNGSQVTYYFYDQAGKLQYRYGKNHGTHSEYHYIGGALYARRDSQANAGGGTGGGGDGGGGGTDIGELVDQDDNDSNIYFLPGNGTRTWVNPDCATSLEEKGVPRRSGSWNDELKALTAVTKQCEELL